MNLKCEILGSLGALLLGRWLRVVSMDETKKEIAPKRNRKHNKANSAKHPLS